MAAIMFYDGLWPSWFGGIWRWFRFVLLTRQGAVQRLAPAGQGR